MKVSYYGKVYDLLPERRDVAWPDFFTRWYEADSDADKEQIPLFSCDLFKDGRGREKGRTRDNVEMVSGLLLDYDDDHGVAIEQAESCWADRILPAHDLFASGPGRLARRLPHGAALP